MHPTILLAQLIHSLGRIEGRKKLQKMVHILQVLGAPFRERFEYSFYGMYSAQLSNEVARLVEEHLVAQSSATAGAHQTFAVETTPELADFLREFGSKVEESWVSLAKELNELSPQVLEGVSTILFLKQRGLTGSELRDRLLSLKPHLAGVFDECVHECSKVEGERMVLR